MAERIIPYKGLFISYVKESRDPTTSDSSYSVPTIWINESNDRAYILTDVTNGVSVWVFFTGASEALFHNDLLGRDAAAQHPATSVTNTPHGDIASTTIQAAINELDIDKEVRRHRVNVFFVGKHGNNARDGLTPADAMLTFGSAITAANAGDVIFCTDNGTYVENITGKTNVNIFAPNANLTNNVGSHTILNGNVWIFRQFTMPAGVIGIVHNVVNGRCHIKCQEMNVQGNSIALRVPNGEMITDFGRVSLANGSLISNQTAGRINLKFNEIEINGTADIIRLASGAEINCLGNTINDIGGAGRLINAAPDATTNVSVMVTEVLITNLSNINDNVNFRLVSSNVDGALNETGAGRAIILSTSGIDNIPIGENTQNVGNFTTCHASVEFGDIAGNYQILWNPVDNSIDFNF